MDFFEAMEKMKEGEKVKIISWSDGKYIGLREEEIKEFGKLKIKYSIIDQNGQIIDFMVSLQACASCQWDVVDED
jgi:hypothetical protein